MRSKISLSIVLCVLAIALLVPSIHASVTVNVGNYSVSNPKILLNYSELVTLQSAILVDATHPDPYTLCQVPKQAEYAKNFELYTRTGANIDTCEGGETKLLEPGKYSLTLQAINRDGNSTIDTVEFNVVGLDIQFISPAQGIANKTPYDVKFWTSEDAICKYSFTSNDNFASMSLTLEADMYVKNHNVHGITYVDSDFFVICKEHNGRMTAKTMRIGFDNSPPVFQELAAIPQKVIDPNNPYSSIIAKTDDKTVCSVKMCDGVVLFISQNGKRESPEIVELYNTTHATTFYYNESPCSKSTSDMRPYPIYNNITCKNLAGYSASKGITVLLNFSEFSYINVLEPSALISKTVFDVVVQPETFTADSCLLDGREMSPGVDPSTFTLEKTLPVNPKKLYNVTLNITCSNSVKTTERLYNITIDLNTPPAPGIDGGNAICSGYIPVKFFMPDGTSVENYTYTLTDGAGLNIQNTTRQNTIEIKIPGTAPTHVKWSVYAITSAGKQSPTNETERDVEEGEDEVCGLPPFITIKSPPLGFGKVSPYTLVLGTVTSSECRFSIDKQEAWENMSKFIVSDAGKTHTKQKIENKSTMYVTCIETANSKVHHKKIDIGIDDTAPRVSIKISPSTIQQDPKVASIEVITDDRTYCTHTSTAGPQFTTMLPTSQSAYTLEHYSSFDYRATSDDPTDYEFDVTCKNLVGKETTVKALLAVDIAPAIKITVLAPPEFVARSNGQNLTIQTDKLTANCYWRKAGNPSSTDFEGANGKYTSSIGPLLNGSNFFSIWCSADDQTSVLAYQVTVDGELPVITTFSGPASACPESTIKYQYTVSGLDQSPTISYSLENDNGFGVSFQQNTTDAILSLPLVGITAGNYTLTAFPINHANAEGPKIRIKLKVLSADDASCTTNHCSDNQKNYDEIGIDCGGICPVCISCQDDFVCPLGEVCTAHVCVKPNACSTQTDCKLTERCENGNCVDASCTRDSDCTAPTICIKSVGMEHGVCNKPPTCSSTDGICVSPYVCDASGTCTVPHCGNLKKDSDETGIDCGGSCNACVSCSGNDSCVAPQTCSSGVCVSPRCQSTADCDMNHVCSTEGNCVPVFVCGSDTQCNGKTCFEGICKEKTCLADTDCLSTEYCDKTNNVCVDATCESNTECVSPKICIKQEGSKGMCNNPPPCTKPEDCAEPYTCNNEVCSLPMCGDGSKDGTETNLDCGGSCPVCITCKDKTECPVLQTCSSEGVCISPVCTTDIECDANHVCSAEGKCIPVFVCTTKEDCPSGICTEGTCVPEEGGCTRDTDCTGEQICKNKICINPTPKPECTKDEDCTTEGEICSPQKTCIAAPTAPKRNLVSYILLIVGLLIMGGAGYFLYQQDVEKKRIAAEYARMQATRAPPRKVVIAPQLGRPQAGLQQPTSQQSRLQSNTMQGSSTDASQKPSADKSIKDNKRNTFFNAFDNGVEGSVATIKDKKIIGASANAGSSGDVAITGTNEEDGFIDISDMKSPKTSKKKDDKTVAVTKSSQDSKESGKTKEDSKKDDPFSDLDKIGK